MENYDKLCEELKALISDVPHLTANLANASALIWERLDGINWAGFYLCENGKLILGPFQGKPACIEIRFGRGVCGTAAEKNETQLVDNVHEFPGHIACDSASNSEIVVPIRKDGKVVGVLDIDSTKFARFSERDKEGIEKFVAVLEKNLRNFYKNRTFQ